MDLGLGAAATLDLGFVVILTWVLLGHQDEDEDDPSLESGRSFFFFRGNNRVNRVRVS
jgi:hypothetical protein